MTEIRVIKTEVNPDPFGVPTIDVLYLTLYRYDEAGNRISKVRYKYTGSTPDPIFEGDNPSWTLQGSEYYIRDVSGKEIAIYSGSSLTQWNIWGLDNVGKINADTTRNYYLKDHLGSIRVVLNSTNTVISAQDYDAWGYPLENRTYNASAMKYDFTGKERDDETSYDYFGARYYDSRIGRWGGIDPITIHSITPYGSMNNNPLIYRDINGKENIVVIGGADIRGQDRYKFVNSGLGAAFDLKSGEPLESTTIVLLTAYLNKDEINSIQGSIRSGSITNGEVNLIMANSTDELINYLNSKSISESSFSQSRSDDLITDIEMFGHGIPSSMQFGLDNDAGTSITESNFTFGSSQVSQLQSSAFNNANILLYTCNSSATAQLFSSQISSTVTGFEGLIDFQNIYSIYNRFLKKIGINILPADRPEPSTGTITKTYTNGKEK